MKSNLKKLVLPLQFFYLCLATASAQETQVSLKVNLVAWGNAVPRLTLKKPSGASTTAKSFTYHETLSYAGSQILEIYQLEDKGPEAPLEDIDADPNDKPPPVVEQKKAEKPVDLSQIEDPLIKLLFTRRIEEPRLVSLVQLPAGVKHVTILLAPAAQGTLQPYVINDDPRKLPEGALRIHNLSKHPVKMEEIKGRQRCQLAPKGTFLFSADEKNRFTYRLKYLKGDTWIAVNNDSLRLPDKQKTQLIVLQSDNQHFISSDGTRSGILQVVVLKRTDK